VWVAEGFQLTDKMAAYAIKQGIQHHEEEFEHFYSNALAKGYQYVDWERAWMNWCRSPYQRQTKQDTGFYDPEGVL